MIGLLDVFTADLSLDLFTDLWVYLTPLPLQGSTNLHLEFPAIWNVFVFLKLSSDAFHGDRPGETDEDAKAVGREDSVFGLSDIKRP